MNTMHESDTTMESFRREVEQAALEHRAGIKIEACLAVDPGWFEAIRRDVRDLVARRPPSEVGDRSHPTYWTNPYGRATQHSLFNASGNTSDTSVDHNHVAAGKTYNAPEYEALGRFVRSFGNRLLNFRINGLFTGAGLSPHEECVVHGERLRLRFHLPVETSEQSTLMLDEERYHARAGHVYYFNNGCVHGAENLGQEVRYHLVFDMFLDDWVWDRVLDPSSPRTPDPGLRKLPPAERSELARSEPCPIDEYIIGTASGLLLRATRQRSESGEVTWVKTPINA
jgi:hypothetical protein